MSGIQQAVISTFISSGPPSIGSPFKGGYYAGLVSSAGNGIADYYLIIAPKSSGQFGGFTGSTIRWKTTATFTSGTDSVIDGAANSANLNNASHPAGQFCEGLSIGGYTDWYLPAWYELEILYYNLKPGTRTNVTTRGTNPYAVPPRTSNYTAGNPPQTPVVDFQNNNGNPGNAESFIITAYWSSSQWSGDPTERAVALNTDEGNTFGESKTRYLFCRAVRREPI